MKQNIYISSDIEGCATVTNWSECNESTLIYGVSRTIMSVELATLVKSAGKESSFLIRDAHGNGRNILKKFFQQNVQLIQRWNKEPTNMMRGIDYKKFDFAVLHGYHAAAGTKLSPLAHTFSSRKLGKFTLNGKIAGETTFSVYTAAYFGVPVIYVLGDYGAVTEAQSINPNIVGTITKKFNTPKSFMLSVNDVLENIKTDFTYARNEFYKNQKKFKITLPKHFTLTLQYKDSEQAQLHVQKIKGVIQIAPDTVQYKTNDFFDLLIVMRKLKLLIHKGSKVKRILTRLKNKLSNFLWVL